MDTGEYLKRFGEHLKKVRLEKGLSIRELELRGEVDRSFLSKVEKGQKNCSVYTLAKICLALEISQEDFFKGFN